MRPVLTAEEMRAADRRTIEEVGVPGAVLMENAGAAVAQVVETRFPSARRIHVLCGKGNNGGDGFVTARRLLARRPQVLLVGAATDVRGDAAVHLRAYLGSGGRLGEIRSTADWTKARPGVLASDLVVDALLGTGLSEAPRGLVARVIRDLAPRAGPVVSIDLPSGVASDGGRLPGAALSADLTVTFAALKCGHVLPPACERCGEVVVADIGIPERLVEAARLHLIEAKDAGAAWGRRQRGAHKGSFGHVLAVAGSLGKTGAAVLAGTAALRGGAGLVTVATPVPALARVAAGRAELMTEPLAAGAAGTIARRATSRALALASAREAVVLGPGLGQAAGTRAFVRDFVARCSRPLIVDADGLNALSALRGDAGFHALRSRRAPTVLTPHPGEAARLLGTTARDVQADRLAAARRLAADAGSVVVLKGFRTIVAEPGGRAAVNPTGNPGLATAGSGDVLSGVVGALLARGREPFTAALAAVYVHGLAADRVAARRGDEGMLAGDVAEALPEALRALRE
ncbi:MAG TPA: NAD(P)H-hydrate dehydratase [Vicinamibacteria bacterium]|nr:NAD(P)H-hydrate dehydratase [Vicinamibacteria bacterium]